MNMTSEQIVTNILSSNEILNRNKECICLTSQIDFGEYLKNLPPEEIVQEIPVSENTKYTFIKEGLWKI